MPWSTAWACCSWLLDFRKMVGISPHRYSICYTSWLQCNCNHFLMSISSSPYLGWFSFCFFCPCLPQSLFPLPVSSRICQLIVAYYAVTFHLTPAEYIWIAYYCFQNWISNGVWNGMTISISVRTHNWTHNQLKRAEQWTLGIKSFFSFLFFPFLNV